MTEPNEKINWDGLARAVISGEEPADRWENEGGAGTAHAPIATPFAGVHAPGGSALTAQQTIALDARQDDLMSVQSVEGRPPTHFVRRLQWHAVAIGLPLAALGGLVWALSQGVGTGEIVGFGVLIVLFLGLGASPVLGAGLLRGREERAARREAVAELRGVQPR